MRGLTVVGICHGCQVINGRKVKTELKIENEEL